MLEQSGKKVPPEMLDSIRSIRLRHWIYLRDTTTYSVFISHTLIVIAPAARPSLPVAIDTAKLASFSAGIWSPLTGREAVDSLQKSITATLGKKAPTADLLKLQREAARQTVTEFVQKWVVQQPRWQGKKSPTIFVFFEDEPLGQRAAPLLAEPPETGA
ncbi:MAG: hypothetical protein NDJ19_03975 [Ramlibacter sp.]|nr:hypothetical protein [Ramlibacter sp.]